MSTPNAFEHNARQLKAHAIADMLQIAHAQLVREGTGFDRPLSQFARELPTTDRIVLASACGQRAPSDETWDAVVEILEAHERRAAMVAEAVA